MSAPINDLEISSKAAPATWVGRILSADRLNLLPRHVREWKKLISSISFSLILHAIILFIISWFYFDFPRRIGFHSLLTMISTDTESTGDGIQIEFPEPAPIEPFKVPGAAAEPDGPLTFREQGMDDQMAAVLSRDTAAVSDRLAGVKSGSSPAPPQAKPTITGKASATGKNANVAGANNDGMAAPVHTDHFKGRGGMVKGALLKRMGGTDESEAAVARGLEWIKNHQLPNGSWNFNHLLNPRCDCPTPGTMEQNPNAATAMALLTFLGAGHTHQLGNYQPEVQKGIDFLLSNFIRAEKGICFFPQGAGQPMFYTHGLATIALSEAYAMTGDMNLRQPIAGAIDFLAATQESGGGWRYFPGQPGDTSVVAWELMALKSAQFSRIPVQQKVFRGVDRFLNSVGSMRNSQFSYLPERQAMPIPSMTAAGLLCRMYLVSKDGAAGLQAGVRVLDQRGPDPDNMYYNYYATQVMHHWGGPEWDRWNNVMRDYLIRTQIQEGHAKGSWDVADRHGYVGGRLYMTSLVLLTLEVYYRHLPLYQRERIDIPLLQQETEQRPAAAK